MDDPDFMSDEDTIAAVFEDGDQSWLEYGVVESLSTAGRSGKSKRATVHQLSRNDPNGVATVRWFESVEDKPGKVFLAAGCFYIASKQRAFLPSACKCVVPACAATAAVHQRTKLTECTRAAMGFAR